MSVLFLKLIYYRASTVVHLLLLKLSMACHLEGVWPDWVIYWTMGNFSKLLATTYLPKSLTFSGNFCKGVKILNFTSEIIFWATFIEIWRFFTGHTAWKHNFCSSDYAVVGNGLQLYHAQLCLTSHRSKSIVWKYPRPRINRPGGSPGLVVMGGDSRSKGCGFESRHRILDGHFSHIFVVKIVLFVWKRPKINEKEAGDGPY